MDPLLIDPALGPVIDPSVNGAFYRHSSFSPFLQLPAGDPFASQPIQVKDPSPEPLAAKPKHKHIRPRICQVCKGDDERNRDREPEALASCSDCAKCWHPSCSQLAQAVPQIFEYDWRCNKCKQCLMCKSKKDAKSMVLCDNCDRGCHVGCLDPPLLEIPDGSWYCPHCPAASGSFIQDADTSVVRGVSEVSSTPGPVVRRGSRKSGRKPARFTFPMDDSDGDMVEVTPKSRNKGKDRAKPVEEDVVMEEPVARPIRRIRLKLSRNPNASAEDGESRRGMFDDYLAPADRDTSRTTITGADKNAFESSRRRAEAKLLRSVPQPPRSEEAFWADQAGPSSRPLRSQHPSAVDIDDLVETQELLHQTPDPTESSGTLRIKHIRFGEYDINTWYNAPFPEEYSNIPDRRLWICEFCLKYMSSGFKMERHRLKCKTKHPPGDEIYKDGRICVFEVDGRRHKIYCQNLCLLSKMFLDHKSLFYDVEPFLFYVITELDREDHTGFKFIGYFSKEKRSPKNYNLSCIMTLPVRQRQGWGNLLMDFSYLLSKKEQLLGSPEKPLSSLGAISYRNYWTLAIMRYLDTAPDHPRLDDICAATSMTKEDVFNTLVHLQLIQLPPVTSTPFRPHPGQAIRLGGKARGRKSAVSRQNSTPTRDDVGEYLSKWQSKGYVTLKPEKLQWSPYLLARVPKTEAVESTHVSDLLTSSISPEDDMSHLYDPALEPESEPLTRTNSYGSITPNTSGATTPRRRGRLPRNLSSLDGHETFLGTPSPTRRQTRSANTNAVFSPSPEPSPTRARSPRKRRRVDSERQEEERDEDGGDETSYQPQSRTYSLAPSRSSRRSRNKTTTPGRPTRTTRSRTTETTATTRSTVYMHDADEAPSPPRLQRFQGDKASSSPLSFEQQQYRVYDDEDIEMGDDDAEGSEDEEYLGGCV
ncbi:hypothetical protein DL96DRAFT_1587598 [Flagelloscypha sp. PMI_526]|nr:hypothetical protein DL96DRAFT_1587598 [Flagelloscypha sp. PMI_526]